MNIGLKREKKQHIDRIYADSSVFELTYITKTNISTYIFAKTQFNIKFG